MAEEDDSQKTEDPTDKRLGKARNKGQVAQSMEVKTWAVLFAGTFGLVFMAPEIAGDVRTMTLRFIQSPDAIPFDFAHLRLTLANLLLSVGLALAPLMALLVIVAILGNIGQFGLLFTAEKIKPELNKISVISGAKRIFSSRSVVEFVKGIIKISLVALVAFGVSLPLLQDLQLVPAVHIVETMDRIHALAIRLAAGTLAALTVIAALDYIYQRFMFMKQMRMSKQELKDEQKESEGDPLVKARIRRLRQERAQQRMMAAVPQADVVITNPTHFAVALEYKMSEMSAPKLVAKGIDTLALRIREIADEHDVPIVENPPLARALYVSVELEEEIPTEHFAAVAEVIGYVMRIKGRTFH